MDDEKDSLAANAAEGSGNNALSNAGGKLAEQGKEQVNNSVKKQVRNKLFKKGAATAAKQSIATALGPIIFWVVVVIIALIIIIGIIMFFVTMPGMAMEKLKALFSKIGNKIAAFFGEDATTQVDDQQIYDVLDYLEQMGYDLKGYGFLTEYIDGNDDGVERDDNGKIKTAYSDFILSYIVSDNYAYTVSNFNQTNPLSNYTSELPGIFGFFDNLIHSAAGARVAIWQKMANLVTNGAAGSRWGQGLIDIYFEDTGADGQGETGTIGSYYGGVLDWIGWNDITVDAEAKTLKLKRGWGSNYVTYSLDGWTGRYSMPLEFLLSIHVATMMPDLSYDMASTFDTRVIMLLHKINNGEAAAAYKNSNGEYILYEDIDAQVHLLQTKGWFSKFLAWFDDLIAGDEEVIAAAELGFDLCDNTKDDCDCEYTVVYADPTDTYLIEKKDDGKWYKLEVEGEGDSKTKVSDEVIEFDGEPLEHKTISKVCDTCRAKYKEVLSYLKKAQDYNFDTYDPYIAYVTGHWYRDVYFVVNPNVNKLTISSAFRGDKNINPNPNLVVNDYNYESVTKERWTLYETDNTTGEYNYYEIDSDGNFVDTTKAYTKEDADKKGIKVAKKAVLFDKTDAGYEDYNWKKGDSNIWSAYDINEGTTSSGWQQAYPESEDGSSEEDTEGSDTYGLRKNIYVNVSTTNNITQTGEGFRSETNPEIKKMFLSNNYFRYDGTATTADIITQLRSKLGGQYGPISDDNMKKEFTIDNETKKVSDYAGNVSLTQDSLNAFSMLENEHTLDADYIYRDFKELIVELGYFEKEELTDETPRLLQWLVPDIAYGNYPDRSIDKNEHEFGTTIHSEGDISANRANILAAALEASVGNEKTTEIIENGNNSNVSVNDPINGLNANSGQTDFSNAVASLGIKTDTTNWVSLGKVNGSTSSSLLSLEDWWDEMQDMFDVFKSESWTYAQDHSCATFESARTSGRHTTDCSLMASWALQKLGVLDESQTFSSYLATGSGLGSDSVAQKMIEAGAEVIVVNSKISSFDQMESGDILFYDGHVSIYCGEGYSNPNGDSTVNSCWDTGSTNGIQAGGPKDCSWEFGASGQTLNCIVRFGLGTGHKSADEYSGYQGNEAVVSPVTGILLEYDTYTSSDIDTVTNTEYRENIDIKYGIGTGNQKDDNQNASSSNGTNANNTQDEEVPKDKVGYAKILVLDNESYQKIEAAMISGTRFDSSGFLSSTGNYKEYADLTKVDDIEDNDWTDKEKTLYAYKEFAESYKTGGISGYIVYIDGFVTELPQEDIDTANIMEALPEGDKLTKDSFKKVTLDNLDLESDDQLDTKYEKDDDYKMASQKATDKLAAEQQIKAIGSSSLSVGGLTVIKEGTVIGRTMTDKELITKIRKQDEAKYKEYRPDVETGTGSGTGTQNDNQDKNLGKVMGNYIRIIFKDLDDTVIENVEDYMKIDSASGGSKTGVYADLEAIDENSTDVEKVRAAMSYFVAQGFTPEAAAGIVGNLIQESSLDPKAVSGAGYTGIAQWSKSWWPTQVDWMRENGYNQDSFAGQVRAILESTNTGQVSLGGGYETMKQLSDIKQAAEFFAVYYEGCVGGSDPTEFYLIGKNYQELGLRKTFAQNAYDIYMGEDKGIKDQ